MDREQSLKAESGETEMRKTLSILAMLALWCFGATTAFAGAVVTNYTFDTPGPVSCAANPSYAAPVATYAQGGSMVMATNPENEGPSGCNLAVANSTNRLVTEVYLPSQEDLGGFTYWIVGMTALTGQNVPYMQLAWNAGGLEVVVNDGGTLHSSTASNALYGGVNSLEFAIIGNAEDGYGIDYWFNHALAYSGGQLDDDVSNLGGVVTLFATGLMESVPAFTAFSAMASDTLDFRFSGVIGIDDTVTAVSEPSGLASTTTALALAFGIPAVIRRRRAARPA